MDLVTRLNIVLEQPSHALLTNSRILTLFAVLLLVLVMWLKLAQVIVQAAPTMNCCKELFAVLLKALVI